MSEQTPNPEITQDETQEQTPNSDVTQDETQEPFIPPSYLLILAALGLAVTIVVWFTQGTLNVVFWGGLAFMVLALIAWAVMAPDQLKAILQGRVAKYGGTSLLVTVVFLTALVAVYAVVRQQEWRVDLTERDQFSLSAEAREVMQRLGADPTAPPIRILAFYDSTRASQQDQHSVLFDDYRETTGGKVDYEFVDPDRDPTRADQYSITRAGEISVVALNENGEPDIENAEKVSFFGQEEISNAILRVAASGDFRAYFLSVEGGLVLDDQTDAGMGTLDDILEGRLNWKTEQVPLFQLTAPESEFTLNDESADGEVIVIPGGTQVMTDTELEILSEYLNNGGDVVIFADLNVEGEPSLATSENLNTYLWENFGLRYNTSIVIDPQLAFQSADVPVATDFDSTHYITSDYTGQPVGMILDRPHPIEVEETPPANVAVTRLVQTSTSSYAKELSELTEGNVEADDDDPKGPFVVVASAENAETGARLVLFSSADPAANFYSGFNQVVNQQLAFNAIVWTTHFNDFFGTIPQVAFEDRPQDSPIFASETAQRSINFLTVLVLPLGTLGLGLLVWWMNREREPGR